MFQWVVLPVAMISRSMEMSRETKLAISSGKFAIGQFFEIILMDFKSMLQRDMMEDETAIIIDMESETYSDSGLSFKISTLRPLWNTGQVAYKVAVVVRITII